MKNLTKWIVVILIITFSFTACANKENALKEMAGAVKNGEKAEQEKTAVGTKTIKVVDIEGRKVELEKPAEKILDCTGLGGVRILIQLEAEELLVGTTDKTLSVFNDEGVSKGVFHPASKAAPELKDLPCIGSYNEPDVQTIISLKPDVILVGWAGKELADSLQKQTGIPTVCIGRLDGHFDYDLYRIVGKVIGKEEKAEKLISYLEEKLRIVTDVTNTIAKEEKKSVYFWIFPLLDKAPSSNGIYDAFDHAGAINVASNEDGIGLYETSKEQIASWDADYMFLQCYSTVIEGYYTSDTLKQDSILQHTKAVTSNNIYNLRGPVSDFDTAVEAAEVFYIAKILYPDLFKDLDVEKHCNEIFKVFYGAEGLYTEMREYTGLHHWE